MLPKEVICNTIIEIIMAKQTNKQTFTGAVITHESRSIHLKRIFIPLRFTEQSPEIWHFHVSSITVLQVQVDLDSKSRLTIFLRCI